MTHQCKESIFEEDGSSVAVPINTGTLADASILTRFHGPDQLDAVVTIDADKGHVREPVAPQR